jgi:hypothetical protein
MIGLALVIITVIGVARELEIDGDVLVPVMVRE